MFLTSIYIVIVLISLLVFIFVSRRRNLKLLISNVSSLIFIGVLISFKSVNYFLKENALVLTEDLYSILSSRIVDIDSMQTFMYVNILIIIYLNSLVGFYLIAKIFVRNKSYFRDINNKVLKVNMKVAFASINTICVLIVSAIILANLNTYFKLELGIFNNIFSLAERVINSL